MEARRESSEWNPCINPTRRGSLQRPDASSTEGLSPSTSSGKGTADSRYLISYSTYIARRKDDWFWFRSNDSRPSVNKTDNNYLLQNWRMKVNSNNWRAPTTARFSKLYHSSCVVRSRWGSSGAKREELRDCPSNIALKWERWITAPTATSHCESGRGHLIWSLSSTDHNASWKPETIKINK